MDWNSFAVEAVRGSFFNVLIMGAIIIPLMIILEAARDMKLLDRFSGKVAPALKIIGMSPEAAFPLLVGIIFGIGYGAGVIIESARSGRMTWKDVLLVNVFLSVCHAVVEDTALFIAVGADPVVLLGGRLALALVITFLFSRTGYVAARNNA